MVTTLALHGSTTRDGGSGGTYKQTINGACVFVCVFVCPTRLWDDELFMSGEQSAGNQQQQQSTEADNTV